MTGESLGGFPGTNVPQFCSRIASTGHKDVLARTERQTCWYDGIRIR